VKFYKTYHKELKQLFSILLLFIAPASFARTIVVGKDQVITSLKSAVQVATDNDTIILNSGIYKEGNIVITKSICLIGVGQPVLEGENRYEILTITGTGIIVKGIHFKNSGYSSMNDYAAISIIDGQFMLIENNIIDHAYFAIHVANAQNCIIRNNKITGTPKTEQTSGNGIHLWKCNEMVIEDNDVTGHRDGIYFEFVTHSTIWGNVSHNNIRYGLHFMFSNNDAYVENTFRENGAGVAVMYSNHVVMLGNLFQQNWGPNAYGILLKEISDATIIKNKFIKNTVGILMESTNRVDVQMNSFKDDGWALRIQASCDESTVHHNNFQGNSFDVATNGTMMLSRFYNNYWDKYEGYDLNRDRFGDVPYHPVSMYSMVVEQNPNALILMRSFMVSLLDKAEKTIPTITPEFLVDEEPLMEGLAL
jgi:nitrous oxidase accessory protein